MPAADGIGGWLGKIATDQKAYRAPRLNWRPLCVSTLRRLVSSTNWSFSSSVRLIASRLILIGR